MIAAPLTASGCAPAPAEIAAPRPAPVASALASAIPSPTASAPAAPSATAQADAPRSPRALTRPPSTAGMVLLPAGSFPSKRLGKTVTVAPFWIDVTEVTARDYRACVIAERCSEEELRCGDPQPTDTYQRPGKEDHPINCVNLRQAREYCAYLGKRLPADYEWEWAARGAARGSTYPWGEDPPAKQLCWKRMDFTHGRAQGTCPVHAFRRGDTKEGLADLAGNVGEWVTSSMPGSEFTYGSSWMEPNPDLIEVSVARSMNPRSHAPVTGFRCAGDEPAP